ncbi:hypothetical protein BD770DRAFT_416111 [Pilaira anomala]|nr:hypothetical protein BD770DRAFT_416111 [Pilaira anomala]
MIIYFVPLASFLFEDFKVAHCNFVLKIDSVPAWVKEASSAESWDITEASQQLSQELDGTAAKRRVKTILQASIDGQNCVQAAKKYKKDKSRQDTAELSRTSNDMFSDTSNNMPNNTPNSAFIVNNNYKSNVNNPIHITNNAPSGISSSSVAKQLVYLTCLRAT